MKKQKSKVVPIGTTPKKEKLTRIPIYFGKAKWFTLRLSLSLWRRVQALAAHRGLKPAELVLTVIMNRVREIDPMFRKLEKRHGKMVAV